jgi:hypothetical protein
MERSSILGAGQEARKGLDPKAEALRKDRIRSITHDIYKQFQIKVFKPNLKYLLGNNKSLMDQYDIDKEKDKELTPSQRIGVST